MGKNVGKERPSFITDLIPEKQEYTSTHTHMVPQKEFKSKRVQLLMKPSTVAGLDAYAKLNGTSRNDIIQNLAEEFLNKECQNG